MFSSLVASDHNMCLLFLYITRVTLRKWWKISRRWWTDLICAHHAMPWPKRQAVWTHCVTSTSSRWREDLAIQKRPHQTSSRRYKQELNFRQQLLALTEHPHSYFIPSTWSEYLSMYVNNCKLDLTLIAQRESSIYRHMHAGGNVCMHVYYWFPVVSSYSFCQQNTRVVNSLIRQRQNFLAVS